MCDMYIYYYYLHFMDEDSEVSRGQVTRPALP